MLNRINNRRHTLIPLLPLLVLVFLVVVLAGCSGVPSAAGSGSSSMENSIAVTGYGDASGEPDMANIQFGISISGETVSEAVQESNSTMEAVIQAMTQLGIPEKDIQTSNFNLWPETRYDPLTGQPTEERLYHVDNTVHVKVKPVDLAPDAIEAALNAGANNVYGLTFDIEDPTSLQTQARSDALVDARVRAQQIAAEIGVVLGQEVVVSEVAGVSPFPAFYEFGMGGGGGAPPISPGELTVSVQLNVIYSFTR